MRSNDIEMISARPSQAGVGAKVSHLEVRMVWILCVSFSQDVLCVVSYVLLIRIRNSNHLSVLNEAGCKCGGNLSQFDEFQHFFRSPTRIEMEMTPPTMQ